MLTTITPVWGREEILRIWLAAVRGATQPGMKHIIFLIGGTPEFIADYQTKGSPFHFVEVTSAKPGEFSIGHYHNIGAHITETEWMMKLDVDALPNVRYFKEMLAILRVADDRDWFNGGMMYVTQNASAALLNINMMPISAEVYQTMMHNRHLYFGSMSAGPAATNFICRTKDYLALGGCDERFRGYGWEDYQQIYMLERHYRRRCPLPGQITFDNVTKRCCREISRVKARELFHRNSFLALLHHFHPASPDSNYKSHAIMLRNKQILLDYILQYERQAQSSR